MSHQNFLSIKYLNSYFLVQMWPLSYFTISILAVLQFNCIIIVNFLLKMALMSNILYFLCRRRHLIKPKCKIFSHIANVSLICIALVWMLYYYTDIIKTKLINSDFKRNSYYTNTFRQTWYNLYRSKLTDLKLSCILIFRNITSLIKMGYKSTLCRLIWL